MLSVSKWVKLPLLVDEDEMHNLFASISRCTLYEVQKVTVKGVGIYQTFLSDYADYIAYLKRGEVPPDRFRQLFSSVLSVTGEAIVAMPVGDDRQLLKPKLPVVQMQAHSVRYSEVDNSFRSHFGGDAISWGITLGYPQIYEEPKTHDIISTRELPNGSLFHEIQKWVRQNTRATPFLVDGVKHNVPIRLGKQCFSWINDHPQLEKLEIAN